MKTFKGTHSGIELFNQCAKVGLVRASADHEPLLTALSGSRVRIGLPVLVCQCRVAHAYLRPPNKPGSSAPAASDLLIACSAEAEGRCSYCVGWCASLELAVFKLVLLENEFSVLFTPSGSKDPSTWSFKASAQVSEGPIQKVGALGLGLLILRSLALGFVGRLSK